MAETNPEKPVFGVWQPIETIPKGQNVLVWSKWSGEIGDPLDEYGIYMAEADDLCIVGGDYYTAYADKPTHWMPLPEPPTK